MNNIIKRKWNQNSMVIIEDLHGMAFQAESGGHTFQISGVDGEGNTVALSGTPAGVMLRSDGQDVTLTCSVSGGVVSATLPANAYSVPGRFGLTIFLTSDGQKTAIYAAVGTVGKTSSGTVAPPAGADVVTLVNAIADAVSTIPASYTDLMASVAPTYSSSGLYAVGSYAWYNGKLYRCTTAITSGETWTSGHWTLANLGSDLVDLKSALTNLGEQARKIDSSFELYDSSFSITGKYIVPSNGLLGNHADWSATDFIYIHNINRFDVTGVTTNPMLAFYDYAKTFIANSGSSDKKILEVPKNAYYVRFSVPTAEASGFTIVNVANDIMELESANERNEQLFDDSMEYESIWRYARKIEGYKIASDGSKYVIMQDPLYYIIAISKKSIDTKGIIAFGVLNTSVNAVVVYNNLVTRKAQQGFANNVMIISDIYATLTSDDDYIVFSALKSADVEFVPYWLNGWPNKYSAKIEAALPNDFILNNNLCLEITKFAPSSGNTGIRSYGTSLNVKFSNAIPLDATAKYYSNFTIWSVVCYKASGLVYASTVGGSNVDFSQLDVTGATHFSFVYDGLSDTDKANVIITKGIISEYTTPKVNPKYINNEKPLQGKTISFLGDSRTSYSGYVPSGNATQYPREDVQSVSDMWFYQVMQNLGLTLMVNDSWAGSTVTYGPVYWMSEDSCACNDKRSKGLDDNGTSPDFVVVWISINDFTTTENIAIGTYDGTGDFPTNKAVFSDAWSIMMKNILDTCPDAKVFVCLETTIHTGAITGFVPVDSRGISIVDWNKRIKELCDIFNVSVIDLSKCGITHWNYEDYLYDGLHPNKAGMKLIADYVTARILSDVYH